MLKVGLIGSVGSMISCLQQLKNIKGIQVIGKSSVGMMEEPEGKFLSISEYNRKELVEAADILIVDKSQLLLPDLMKSAIRNGKHLYITDFPDITVESCAELLKLADEAKTVVHIKNHLRYETLTGWLAQNWQGPAYISLFESMPALPDKRTFLIKYLLYAYSLFNSFPQKIRVSCIHQSDPDFHFFNIRLDYPTYSTFNLELLIQPSSNRNMRVAMPGKFLEGDFTSNKAVLNQHEFPVHPLQKNIIPDFLLNYGKDDFYQTSNLDQFHSTLLILKDVLKKIELFTPWH